MSSLSKAETPTQARRWQARLTRYTDAGLCHRCAAQAAYGATHGWSVVHAPCASCEPVVQSLPVVKTNGWRALASTDGDSVRISDRRGSQTPGIPEVRTHGAGRPVSEAA